LEKVLNELSKKKAEMKETNREKKFREMLTNLKRIFPSVRDRLIDLCSVPRDRYKIAVTVTLGRNMDSIVVDDEKTAKECIKVSSFHICNQLITSN
jgi:structural maintenance of chromosome 1